MNEASLIQASIEQLERVSRSMASIGETEDYTEAAINALEKQIPKNPYHISQVDDNDNANVECPVCHATADYAVNVIKRGYCWKCGRLLDWSDEE